MNYGYLDEAAAWRAWLIRAAAGDPGQLQIMYGIAGERDLFERTLDWLPGFEQSVPVRTGNAAAGQLQLDVFGEVSDALHHGRHFGMELDEEAWALEHALLLHLEEVWKQPDEGIWEVRGEGSHAEMLLHLLPPIVHIRRESDKAAMRWSLERLREELRDPQPGGSLIAQQLAYMMLIQALARPGGRHNRWSRLAFCAVGQAYEYRHYQHAQRSRIPLDAARAGRTCRYVALGFRATLSRDCWHDAYGIPRALAHASGCRAPKELRRKSVRHCAVAWLRIRKRLR
jgi:hypothetical protein